MTTTQHTQHNSAHGTGVARRRISTETKASFKTTELIAYVAAVVGVLVASALVDVSDFGAQEAWFYVTLLTIGYMVSRGLAKSGSRDFYDDDSADHGRTGTHA
ncbi:hypothetical protein INN71_11840 [Nocardioides sp. ChNu-153]|uniref:hypothetical protein n=1 Tax=unclassified Nocardioides TaxID=2615069 RepID=UPI002407604B|nr:MULTISPECIES: hypothetical protein [unclassified Nocardioides]MDF9716501.1 hypothetical protein [Nocardioides sp. ChNu-99]MDN7122080.1 hypothetical protein [Nocardioides sp. ChNu-153]